MSVCHLIMAFVSQWLDSDVFLIRRSIIPCWHSIIQYRFLENSSRKIRALIG